MNIINVEDAPVISNPHKVSARKLYDKENAFVTHLTLLPGEALKKHITPVDVVFYVLEGKGVVEVGDEKMEVTKDTLIDSPKEIPHCWYNESSEVLKVLVVKTPRPEVKTKVL